MRRLALVGAVVALVAAGCGSQGVVAPAPGTVVGSLPQRPPAAKGDPADRTLIAEDVELRPRTREAIARVRAKGIHVVVVTGRMFQAVKPYVDAAGIDEPVVCYQGAVVAEPATGRFLRHVPIPLELAREAIAALEGWPINCYVDDELYVAEHTEASRAYAEFQKLEVQAVGAQLD